jgi:hypothetical protein
MRGTPMGCPRHRPLASMMCGARGDPLRRFIGDYVMGIMRTLCTVAMLAAATTASAAEVTLYSRDNFSGKRLNASDTIVNLANSGFNDRATSVIVRDGAWQLCDDAYFRGRCVTLQPGRYASLRQIGLDNRISSVRELGHWGPPPSQGGGGWGGGARAILYSNPDFGGERYVVDGNTLPDLANSGFNDRAQSLRVERGYWIFCSDAGFQGTCRTFGPGGYPALGWGLDNKVSSGRRISDEYPYNGPPHWSKR